jgi:hypothetical protein
VFKRGEHAFMIGHFRPAEDGEEDAKAGGGRRTAGGAGFFRAKCGFCWLVRCSGTELRTGPMRNGNACESVELRGSGKRKARG